MIITLSPAKSLDFNSEPYYSEYSNPRFLNQSKELVEILKKRNASELSKLFGVSDAIAQLNYQRFQSWKLPFNRNNAKQAVFAFNGAVYRGFTFQNYSKKNFEDLQKSVRILSGLYGILKPLDLIQPYRLEMRTKLKNKKGKNLYDFWKDTITNSLNKESSKTLVNLASKEYSEVIDQKKLNMKIITPIFKDYNKGSYKVIGLFAKKARGLFANFIVKNNPKNLTEFSENGYKFDKKSSTDSELVFLRKR